MSQPAADAVDLTARVVALIVTAAALIAFTSRGPETVQAGRVELVDAKGMTRAALTTDTSGVMLTLFDKKGRPTGSLRLNDDPRLAVVDRAGHELAGLGAPRVQHLTE